MGSARHCYHMAARWQAGVRRWVYPWVLAGKVLAFLVLFLFNKTSLSRLLFTALAAGQNTLL